MGKEDDETNKKKDRKGRTYEEIVLSPEVLQRGVDLVAPLSRILLRRATKVKEFHGKTTDAEWEAFEQEFNITIPADFKLLTNTLGTTGRWFKGQYSLTSPQELAKSIRSNQTNYHRWQLEGKAHEFVGVWPEQPAFHMEWGCDEEGNALAYYWVCAKHTSGTDDDKTTPAPAAWPSVMMELEAPMKHNSNVYLCTVTEMLYRDVLEGAIADYDDDDDDDDDDDEEEDASEYEKIIMGEGEEKRCVYQFALQGEPLKKQAKKTEEEDIGAVGSDEDKKDMSMLESLGDLEQLRHIDVKTKCQEMELVTEKLANE